MSKTGKNLKRKNLRNNEYYNLQQTFDELYKQSCNGKRFRSLMQIITQKENILLAYRNIKNNKGSHTRGIDSKDVEYLANMTVEDLVSFIRKKLQNYFPKKVRRVEIPKPNGKTRPLGIPTIEDRLIQQCILQVLDPICEAKFYKYSYGFRPLRSAQHAIERCHSHINITNLYYVVDVDIKGFFDNIDHPKLMKQLWALGIQDKSLLKVIAKMLKAEIDGVGVPTKGTPQGGILSPLLANIVLNEFDWWIASQWDEHKSHFHYKRVHGRKNALKKSNLKEMYIVRYADDFKIFCRNHRDAKKVFTAVKDWLETRLKLEVSPEKSKITNLKKNYSEFLGIKIKARKKRKVVLKNQLVDKYTSSSHVADKAKERIVKETRVLIKRIQRSAGKEAYVNIDRYNAYVIGVHNYYNIATHSSQDFGEISFLSYSMRRNRLDLRRRKHEEKIPRYIEERYGKSKCLRFVNNKPLLPISYVKFHSHPTQGLSPYIEADRQTIHSKQKAVSHGLLRTLLLRPAKEKSVEFNDNRISLFVAQKGKCAITGRELNLDEIHCHHKTPVKLGGNDKYFNLIIVHKEIHKLIHASTTSTISYYMQLLNLDEKKIEKINSLRKQAQQKPII